MPLMHSDLKGPDFIVALLDCGQELMKYFEFDAHQIDKIVNHGVSNSDCVSMEDIELVAIAGVNENYLAKRLSELGETVESRDKVLEVLRNYLVKKYDVSGADMPLVAELA